MDGPWHTSVASTPKPCGFDLGRRAAAAATNTIIEDFTYEEESDMFESHDESGDDELEYLNGVGEESLVRVHPPTPLPCFYVAHLTHTNN
jgi:hypothetical protein